MGPSRTVIPGPDGVDIATLSDTLASAFTLEQVADFLRLSRSRLLHRLTDRSLWAFTVRGRRYLPRWQFTDARKVIPGLAQMVPAIPATLHPLAVDSFMTSPHPDFDGHTQVEWLTSGGDPSALIHRPGWGLSAS